MRQELKKGEDMRHKNKTEKRKQGKMRQEREKKGAR